jgi:hypothetical protein
MQPKRLPVQTESARSRAAAKILKIFASAEATPKIFVGRGKQAKSVARQAEFSLLLPSGHERNYR